MTFEAFLIKFGHWAWVSLLVLAGYVWNKQDKKIQSLEEAHKAFVKKEEAEKMVRDIVDPIIQDQKEVKADIKNLILLVTEIQRDLAVQSAVYKLQHNKDD